MFSKFLFPLLAALAVSTPALADFVVIAKPVTETQVAMAGIAIYHEPISWEASRKLADQVDAMIFTASAEKKSGEVPQWRSIQIARKVATAAGVKVRKVY